MTTEHLGKPGPEIPTSLASPCEKSPKSPILKSLSTLQRDFRIGRSPNYVSTTQNVRNQLSPNPSYRRYTINDVDFGRSTGSGKLSNEHIFDLMEREQDGIVLKLMKEITALKEENRQLKSNINSMNSIRRTSSLSSNRSSVSSSSAANSVASKQSHTHPALSTSIFNKDDLHDSRKKFKRRYSNEVPPPSLSSLNDHKNDLNLSLKDENEELKREIRILRNQLSTRK